LKPEKGQKLNKEAVITLFNRQPKENESPEAFEERLKKVCQKQGTQHITYNKETHEWSFKVPHM